MAVAIKEDALLQFLNENKYDIIWAFLGEKIIMNGSHQYGRLELSGAFRRQEGKLKGVVNHKLVLREGS